MDGNNAFIGVRILPAHVAGNGSSTGLATSAGLLAPGSSGATALAIGAFQPRRPAAGPDGHDIKKCHDRLEMAAAWPGRNAGLACNSIPQEPGISPRCVK
jgi:hypothetical protein